MKLYHDKPLSDFAFNLNLRRYTMGGRGGHMDYPLSDLLPHAFGPLDLTHDAAAPLMLEPRDNKVALPPAAAAALHARDDHDLAIDGTGVTLGAMLEAAVREANLAYAPYSQSPAGLALLTKSQRIFSGRSVESAAYNPTMSPLHAALVAAVGSDGLGGSDRQGAGPQRGGQGGGLGGCAEQEQGLGGGWSDIAAAVLVGTDGLSTCSPRHQTHFEPSFLESNGIL